MRDIGLVGTEFGPDGFLPDEPEARRDLLAAYGLSAVGGFIPVVLHDPAVDPVADIQRRIPAFLRAGADRIVLAAATGHDGYDSRPVLDELGWATLLRNLDRVADAARVHALATSLHPHVGTMIETADEVERVLSGSDIPLCLDTGHMTIGGTDVAAFVDAHADRVGHVHVKDVDAALAARVRAGEVSYTDAVRQGLYTSIGAGDIDFLRIIGALERAGYRGVYVLERDVILDAAPQPGDGPAADVAASAAYLGDLIAGAAA
ncbi:inosose dehydratase [Microbacterium protaetiae]|uniref:Inosose dehydratase n=2 Tax=Microbacterium protaetiae TaxID=2509458 RepID=A0A4P6EJ86_9MICO|nr:inosose dehydratase [Microbacterium protaetiae]